MDTLNNASTILSFFLGIFMMLAVFLLFFLLKNRTLRRSGVFLMLLVGIVLLHLLTYLFFLTGFIYHVPHFLAVSYPLLFLLGPLYYFFLKTYFDEGFRFKLSDAFHLLPFLVITGYHITIFSESSQMKVEIIDFLYHRIPNAPLNIELALTDNLHMVLLCIYSVFSLRYVLFMQKQLTVKTVSRLTFGVLIFSVIYMLVQTGLFFVGKNLIISEITLFILYGALVFGIAIHFLDLLFMVRPSKKYRTSSLTNAEMERIEKRLLTALEEEKLYRNPHIRIANLALQLDIPKHHLSQTLSERMDYSFYDLINKYRVTEVKKKLMDGEAARISIQAIGEECGFNNKTSFYRAFKKIENTTPYNYLRQNF